MNSSGSQQSQGHSQGSQGQSQGATATSDPFGMATGSQPSSPAVTAAPSSGGYSDGSTDDSSSSSDDGSGDSSANSESTDKYTGRGELFGFSFAKHALTCRRRPRSYLVRVERPSLDLQHCLLRHRHGRSSSARARESLFARQSLRAHHVFLLAVRRQRNCLGVLRREGSCVRSSRSLTTCKSSHIAAVSYNPETDQTISVVISDNCPL